MMLLRTIAFTVLAAVASVAVVGATSGAWAGAITGGGASLCAALGALWIVHAMLLTGEASPNRFLGTLAAGMLLRMVLLGVGLAVAVAVLDLGPVPFIVSFFLVYLVSQILEVRYVHLAGKARTATA